MKTFTQIRKIEEGAEIYTVKKGSYTRKVDGKTADKMKRQGWKLVAKEDGRQDEQIAKMKAKAAAARKKVKDKYGKLKALPGAIAKKLKNLPGADVAKKLAEVKSVLQADIAGLKHISDIEIRFSDEKEWKRMSALVKKELKKPAYKGVKDVYYSPDPLQIGFGDPKGKSKINLKPIVDLIIKQTKDPETRLKSLQEQVIEGKMIWNHKPVISDGTMQMGIFDGDKEKAMESARQLIFFLRKNKKTKIGKKDPEQNDSNADIAKYSEELSKLIFDDKLLDDLEPNGNNENQSANDIVVGRLRDLGVRIK
jgi:hypothetical protein